MENTLTYKEVRDRCKDIAMELTPDMPTTNSVDAWESFNTQLDHLRDDSYSQVLESVESTDWAIYTHYGWKILHAVPQDLINDAEENYLACNGDLTLNEIQGGCFDIWSLQSAIAFYVLVAMVEDSLSTILKELQDMAQTTIDNLEGN